MVCPSSADLVCSVAYVIPSWPHREHLRSTSGPGGLGRRRGRRLLEGRLAVVEHHAREGLQAVEVAHVDPGAAHLALDVVLVSWQRQHGAAALAKVRGRGEQLRRRLHYLSVSVNWS
ncbi:hypothetical protein MTO96_011098 [Rhipicephalus appendiculatus]